MKIYSSFYFLLNLFIDDKFTFININIQSTSNLFVYFFYINTDDIQYTPSCLITLDIDRCLVLLCVSDIVRTEVICFVWSDHRYMNINAILITVHINSVPWYGITKIILLTYFLSNSYQLVAVYPLQFPLLVGGVWSSRLWSTSQLLRPSGQQCTYCGGVCPQIHGWQYGAYVGAVEEMMCVRMCECYRGSIVVGMDVFGDYFV